MHTFKVCLQSKEKQFQQFKISASDYDQLVNGIKKKFSIQNFTITKPGRIHNQESFKKQVQKLQQKEKQIVIVKKFCQNQNEIKKKLQQKENNQNIKKQNQQKLLRQQLKKQANQKLLKLRQNKIQERGIQYFDPQEQLFVDLGIQYAVCPLHLLVRMPEIFQYCINQKVQIQRIQHLLIQELKIIFQELKTKKYSQQYFNPNKQTKTKDYSLQWKQIKNTNIQENYFQKPFICPFQWITSWLIYSQCQIVQIPFPTLDIDYFLKKTLKTIFNQQIYKQFSSFQSIPKLFQIQAKFELQNIAQYQQRLSDHSQKENKKTIVYHKQLLQCDLSKPEFSTICKGIKSMFNKRLTFIKTQYDIRPMFSTILCIQNLSKYVFTHLNRFGYINQFQQENKLKLSQGKKSFHKVQYSRTIDFKTLCSQSCIQKIQKQNLIYSLTGIIFHKGDFYHQRNQKHNHDCIGDFQTMVQDNGNRWLKYHRAQVQEITLDDAVDSKYWGNQNEWTPVLLLYRSSKQQFK